MKIKILLLTFCFSAVSLAQTTRDGSVPQDRLVKTVMSNPDKYSIGELDTMYRQDIKNTEPYYDLNLKNMWFVIINQKLVDNGGEALKRYYIKEQMQMQQNLANFQGFYSLLLSASSFMDSTLLINTSQEFSRKNSHYIENMKWSSEDKKNKKLTELNYEAAKFQRFISLKK